MLPKIQDGGHLWTSEERRIFSVNPETKLFVKFQNISVFRKARLNPIRLCTIDWWNIFSAVASCTRPAANATVRCDCNFIVRASAPMCDAATGGARSHAVESVTGVPVARAPARSAAAVRSPESERLRLPAAAPRSSRPPSTGTARPTRPSASAPDCRTARAPRTASARSRSRTAATVDSAGGGASCQRTRPSEEPHGGRRAGPRGSGRFESVGNQDGRQKEKRNDAAGPSPLVSSLFIFFFTNDVKKKPKPNRPELHVCARCRTVTAHAPGRFYATKNDYTALGPNRTF